MRRPLVVSLVTTALLGLAACTGGTPGGSASPAPSSPAATSAPAPSPSSGPATGSPSPSSTLATLPAKQCLTGRYALVRFVAASDQTYGTGEGGDLAVDFADGGYTLTGAGKKPMQIVLAGSTAKLTVDGVAKGSYRVDGSTATFTTDSTKGSGLIALGSGSRRLSMDEVTSVVGLRGDGQVACTAEAMTITLRTVRLELARS